jgi:DNA-binding HxlR family transcriptional regulator
MNGINFPGHVNLLLRSLKQFFFEEALSSVLLGLSKKVGNVHQYIFNIYFPYGIKYITQTRYCQGYYYNICYNILMKINGNIITPAMPEACCETPMGKAIRLIGDVWLLLIVINLLRGPKRFNELRDLLGHISPKTLSQRLKLLEEIGFVERRAFAEIPPRVEYHITEKGRALGEVIEAIEQFAEQNLGNSKAPTLP